ncbi:hypothetical protein BC831DRAFT_442520, partial [Entophlyctis helioformis]
MYNALAWDQTALFISVIGLILNGLLVSSIFFSKSLRNQGETILNANLAFSDLLLSIIRVIKYSGILSGAYTDYDKICELEGIFMSTVYTSILTLTSVAVYNYAIIVPESRPQISRRLLFLCSLGLWIIGGAFSVMPVVFGMRFVHHTVTSFCTTTLNTPPTVSMVKLIFDIPVFSTCVVTINYAYGMILRKFSLIHKGMNRLVPRTLLIRRAEVVNRPRLQQWHPRTHAVLRYTAAHIDWPRCQKVVQPADDACQGRHHQTRHPHDHRLHGLLDAFDHVPRVPDFFQNLCPHRSICSQHDPCVLWRHCQSDGLFHCRQQLPPCTVPVASPARVLAAQRKRRFQEEVLDQRLDSLQCSPIACPEFECKQL